MLEGSSDEAVRTLRIGVMCRGRWMPSWQAAAIRHLLAVPGVEISLLIVPAPGPARGRFNRLADWRHLLWLLFNKGYIERRSRASRAVDLSKELADVAEIECSTERTGRFGEKFRADDLGEIQAHALDVILRFAFGILKGGILDAARFGVWSFHHGDERSYRGRPPGFWELVEGESSVGAILQRLTERLDGGVVLHRGAFRSYPYSYRRTRDEVLSGSSVWPSIVVRMIQQGDPSTLMAPPSPTDAPVRYDPGNLQTAAFLIGQAWRFLMAQVRGMTRSAIWTVGVADRPIASFLDGAPADFRWIGDSGGGRYVADPFAREHDGTVVALVEQFDYSERRGLIAAVDLNGPADRAELVLDTGVHASYPYLLEHDGEVYCVPETFEARQVRLYRAVEFPTRWELAATLLDDVAAVDSTVFWHDDRWWMFCTDRDDGANEKLYIWHAAELLGPWQEHRLNPVKTDVRSSRPAGTPFVHEGELYRPAQDCSSSYGGSVVITKVTDLSPTSFREEVVARVDPPATGKYRAGLHTLSSVGSMTVADCRRDTFVSAAFRHELSSRIRKLIGR